MGKKEKQELPVLSDAELIARYVADMEWRELQPTTVAIRKSYLRKFSREVGFREATQQNVQTWLSRPTLQPQTRGLWLTTLHGAYAFWNHEGYFKRVKNKRGFKVDFDPTSEIVKPKAKKGKPHPISEEDLNAALDLSDKKMKCWLLLGAMCGCRCQEIALIERGDVHDADPEPWLRIVHGKGNKERDVPLHEDVVRALMDLPMADDGRLWNMTPQEMSRAINDFLHHEVGTKSTAHALRHRFATQVFRNGLDLQLTADLMGHSNTAITSVYAAADHRKAAGIVGSIGMKTVENESSEELVA